MAIMGIVLSLLAASACSPASAGKPVDESGQSFVSSDGSVTERPLGSRGSAIQLQGATLDGGSLDLADLRGKVVVINVWGSWCPPCRKEAPTLKAVSDELSSTGVVFVGIDTRDNDASARAFVDTFDLSYRNIVDKDGTLLLAFSGDLNPQAIPSTLVLDRQGRVAARVLGGVTEGTLRGIIEPVVAEPKPGSSS